MAAGAIAQLQGAAADGGGAGVGIGGMVRVNVPVPALASPPLAPLMTPAKVDVELSPPVVEAPLPSVMELPATPLRLAMVWLLPLMSSKPPAPVMLTVALLDRTPGFWVVKRMPVPGSVIIW